MGLFSKFTVVDGLKSGASLGDCQEGDELFGKGYRMLLFGQPGQRETNECSKVSPYLQLDWPTSQGNTVGVVSR